MDLGLQDRVMVVTGGASGIGAAITRACLAESAKIVVLSRVSPGVEEFLAELQSAGGAAELLPLEIEDPETCRAAIKHVQQSYGRLDCLVNNAGVNDGVGLEHGNPDRFQASLRRNLSHCYSLAHYACRCSKPHGEPSSISAPRLRLLVRQTPRDTRPPRAPCWD